MSQYKTIRRQTAVYQPPLFSQRRLVKDMAREDQPAYRLQHVGPMGMATTELISLILQTPDALALAQTMLHDFQTLSNLYRATLSELQRYKGVGESQAQRIKAAFELGRRLMRGDQPDRPQVGSPAEAANLLMPDMMLLEQEHLRVILLDTRNKVIAIRTIYIGSLNSAMMRIGELFKAAVRENAAAIIVSHSHPSGDPSPSPEDVAATRQMVKAGELLSCEVLDHIIIGHQRYVSLKERGLGFDTDGAA